MSRRVLPHVERCEPRLMLAVLHVNTTGANGAYTDINAAIYAAQPGDTIEIAAGTYTPGIVLGNANRRGLFIDKPLTIRGAGRDATIVSVPLTDVDGAAAFVLASNVRLEHLTLQGQADGISVYRFFEPSAIISNIVLRELNIQPLTTRGFGSGLFIRNASNVLFENNTVDVSHTNAVSITENVTGTILKANTFLGSTRDYSISLGEGSTQTLVAGNNISGSPNGIAITSSNNAVFYNTISGFLNDGITLDRQSNHNLIGLNLVDSAGLASGRTSGSGIFLNSESNHNVVFNNRFTGSFENGVALFRVSNNLIWGNEVSGNGQGGIFLNDNDDTVLVSNGRRPQYNVVVENYSHDNVANGKVQGVRAERNEVARNYLSVAPGQSVDGKTGLRWEGGTLNTATYNIFHNLGAGIFFQPNSTSSAVFRNRFISALSNHIQSPATAALDAGPRVGGNYYSDNPSTAVGNPTSNAIYTRFIYTNGVDILDGHADAHPFSSETLGLDTAVTILEPAATTFVGVGTRKTVRFFAPAATRVRLELISPTHGTFTVADNAPNTGIYRWQVATDLPGGDDYRFRLTPLNAANESIGPAVESDAFSVRNTATPITVLSPVRGQRFATGTSVRVNWNYASSNPVNVQYQVNHGEWVTLASNVTGDFADVVLPATATPLARFRVVDPVTGAADTMDGYFHAQAADGTAAFVASPTGTVAPGDQPLLRWVSPSGSTYVNVELLHGDGVRLVASELPDIGEYRLFVPDLNAPNATLRLTFKNASGATISTVTSPAFAIDGLGSAVVFYGPQQNPALPQPPPPANGPDFTATAAASLKPRYVVDGRTRITATVRVTNAGNQPFSGNIPIAALVSATPTPDTSAPVLTVAPRLSLRPGQSRPVKVSFTLPTDRPTGDYHLLFRVNHGAAVAELSADNNLTSALPLRLEQPFVDVAVSFRNPPASVLPGARRPTPFAVVLTNAGNVPARGSVVLDLLRSAADTLDPATASTLASLTRRVTIAPGRSTVITLPVRLAADAEPGSGFVFATAFGTFSPAETLLSNNTASTPVAFGTPA
ncbi:MAG: right-handed parallel beta-helix repeat-containing protein [Tepidisphaerales bacterium]